MCQFLPLKFELLRGLDLVLFILVSTMPSLGPKVKQGLNKHTMNGLEPILGTLSCKCLVLLPVDKDRFRFPSSDLFAETTAQGELTLASLVQPVRAMAGISSGLKLNGEEGILPGGWSLEKSGSYAGIGRKRGGEIFGPSKTPKYSPGNAIAKSSCGMTCGSVSISTNGVRSLTLD